MKGQTYIILAVVFAVIIAIFAVINVDPVEVNYLFGSGEAPLILVILFSVLMGAVITAAVGVFRLIRLQREIRLIKEENHALKAHDTPEGEADPVNMEEKGSVEMAEKDETNS
ncbi:Uncharacterized integral membrane protein [Gracilibacillus ureilyticus]|uniref:Uncharacterized integral membrane protein n=1 Tax=Gracilibacillus ureilyticus TaxID=531814 RepID=A0A1H9RNX8_9BACI|nr:lipopolysaccharide assembly protein LapA domain-containing protein [Gracilibacillus ureilyticus]SER73793.1 Uncharacterized integral membrane protein [Gracilibacillus ureilyticus]